VQTSVTESCSCPAAHWLEQDVTSSSASIDAASHVAWFEDTWNTDIDEMNTIVQIGGGLGQVTIAVRL
jgi:hypothetical protein